MNNRKIDLGRAKAMQQNIIESVYKIGCEVLEGGRLPEKAHQSDAGFDVFATEDVVLERGKITKVPLNIKLEIPKDSYLHVHVKSGLGSRGMTITSCVVDSGYRGIPHVVASCLVDEKIEIKKGQKIAQLVPYPFSTNYYIQQVEKVNEESDRGDGGFGSTGA